MKAYFSNLLPNTLILATENEGLIGVPMVGNKQYGWNKRRRLHLHQHLLHHQLTGNEYRIIVGTYAPAAMEVANHD